MTVLGPVEMINPQETLGLGDTELRYRDCLVLLVDLEVEVGDELLARPRVETVGRLPENHLRRQACELDIELCSLLRGTGDDQRRARFVDQDVVDLVDDRVAVARALAPILAAGTPL